MIISHSKFFVNTEITPIYGRDLILEFTDQVEESRQKANHAALDIPAIQEKLGAAEENINMITEELYTASDKAKEARDLAQEAQKQYADKASEVWF